MTGATGFLGQRVTQMLCATLPNVEVLAMSRTSVQRNEYVFSNLAKYRNLQFVQYDCATEWTVPHQQLENCLSVVHLVGGLRTSQTLTRLVNSLINDVREQKIRRDRNTSKQVQQLEALMHVFYLSAKFYHDAQKERSEVQISQIYETTRNMAR